MTREERTAELQKKQPLLYQTLSKSLERHTIAHAYLFEGASGTGKHEMALWLAQGLFCKETTKGIPCAICSSCLRIQNHEHPDVFEVKPDGQTIKVDQIRQLKSEFTKSGMETNQKVFIIYEAEKMSASAANSLLKFIEEPDGNVTAILLTQVKNRILPTIQSRCQCLTFLPLSSSILSEQLLEKGATVQQAELLVHLTNNLVQAVELLNDDWFNQAKDLCLKWFQYLVKEDLYSFIFVQKEVIKLFKEKEQQILFLDIILFFYRKEWKKNLLDKEKACQLTKQIEEILMAKQRLSSNVSFQNVCEQLALHLIL